MNTKQTLFNDAEFRKQVAELNSLIVKVHVPVDKEMIEAAVLYLRERGQRVNRKAVADWLRQSAYEGLLDWSSR